MVRSILPEQLDWAEPAAAAASLRDLTRINRYLGGYSTMRSMLSNLVRPDAEFSLLDVGAASGDMAAALQERYPKARVTLLDRLPHHLAASQGRKVVGDGFNLPFGQRSFDYVFSSLFLHHFEDEVVVRLLAEFGRCAREAVLAIDLERGPIGYYFIPATRWLFRWNSITVHDAPASVRAGFKGPELILLSQKAGLKGPTIQVHRPWSRLSLVARV